MRGNGGLLRSRRCVVNAAPYSPLRLPYDADGGARVGRGLAPAAISLPLRGSEATRAVVNDSPVGCQSREWTEPQRDRWPSVARSEGVFRRTPPAAYGGTPLGEGGLWGHGAPPYEIKHRRDAMGNNPSEAAKPPHLPLHRGGLRGLCGSIKPSPLGEGGICGANDG